MLTPPYARIKMNFVTLGIKPFLNDFWFSVTGTFPGGWNVSTAALALENHYKANLLACLHSQIDFLGTDFLVNNAGIVSTKSTYTGGQGDGVDTLVPIEVAAVVRLQASAAGGVGRGRIFVSGLDSTLVNGGRLSSAGLTAFATFATTCQTAITDQGITYHPAVYSRKDNLLYNLQYAVVDPPLGTQRNRRTRR